MPFTLSGEGRSLINRSNSNDQNSDLLLTEKQNLLCVFKLVIKDLLDSSLKRERILENEFFPLRHFFIVLEHILLHGYIGKKSFSISSSSNNRKDLWPIIELISRKSTDIHITEISMSSKEMTNIRTSLGRVRAWLRLALMQKRLADYFKILIEQKQELNDLYDHQAILLSDESTIITGLLVGLNVLDFNFCLKEMILDYPIESLIHYHLYLRERRLSTKNTHPPGAILDPQDDLDDYSSLSSSSPISTRRIIEPNDETLLVNPTNDVESFDETNNSDIPSSISDQRMKNILDQKNYLEELNRNLQKTVTNLQDRLQTLEQTYKSSLEDKTRLKELEEQLAKSQTEKEQMQLTNQRKIETLNADIQVERETYQRSRTGFDSIYNELQKKYEDERLSKQKIEDVYQTQLTQNKNQTEIIKNLEQELESQINLCNQLKEECTHLTEKLQIEATRCDEKEQQLQSIEKENQYLRQTISELEANIESINKEIHKLTAANEKLHRKTNKLDADKASLETDLNVEQDFHQRLQSTLNNEKEKVSMLQLDLHELTLMKQEYESYKKEMSKRENDYEKRIQEHDKTIQELAFKLELSIKREDEFREKDGLRSLPWMKDTNVKECGQCKKDFNPLRRRHHCRNCGQIFCEGCASMKLALSSSSKPVRVCDTCRNHLLAECAVNSS